MIQAIVGALFGVGLFFLLSDAYKLPLYKTQKAVENLSKKQKGKKPGLEIWLGSIAECLSKIIRINEFKRAQLEADLKTAQMDITPERYKADAFVKAGLIGILTLPMAFIFPLFVPFILILSFVLYRIEIKRVTKKIAAKRSEIEYELPRLVFNIEKTLAHNRDVLYMLESYIPTAGDKLKHELTVTVADMKSGNYEDAIIRLESRVGSSMMSDVCRGLIGILRGDDNRIYWATLALKFNDAARQQLRLKAQKVPKKVKWLSMSLLVCFMLIYAVVIIEQIMSSIGVLFN